MDPDLSWSLWPFSSTSETEQTMELNVVKKEFASRNIDLKKIAPKKRAMNNVIEKCNRQGTANWSDMHSIPSKSMILSPSPSTTLSPSPSKTTPSPSTTTPSPSTTMAPPIRIPRQFEWIHATSTQQERRNFIRWAHFEADEMEDEDEGNRLVLWAHSILTTIASSADPENDRRFLDWVHSASTMGVSAEEPNRLLKWAHGKAAPDKSKRFSKWVHSTTTMAASAECKRLLKWAPYTARIAAPDRWSLQEEISKPFEIALEDGYPGDSYPDLKQKHMIYTYKGKHGVYECRDALWIWPGLLNCPKITVSELDRGPKFVGKKIKKKFPNTDMIKGRPSVNKLGFVTIKLSGTWIAKSIHKMLKGGIDTWAPKLHVEKVLVDVFTLSEEMPLDVFHRSSIGCTLMNILEYSKVHVIIGHPSILTNSSKSRLIYGNEKADWIVYIMPARGQEYMDMMCSTADTLERGITIIPSAPASYAGYQTSILEDNLLDKAKTRCLAVEQGEAAKLLGYSAEAILDCVFRYTFLTNHRLVVCTFDIDEMLNEQGNTFIYLLNTQAKIRRITDDSCEGIDELKKASTLILEKDEGWEKGEERMLGLHLLEFTEVVEDSCLCVLPHILCEYLYTLCKKFNSYYSSVFKVESIVETSTLLLCESTAVVMDKCFHLLGITPAFSFFSLSMTQPPLRSPLSAPERSMDVNARGPPRNSRFELFSFRTKPVTHFRYDKEGKLFGRISVSDKYGLLLDGGSQFFQPDFGHVSLFNHDWCNPINMIDNGLVYLGNPSSHHSVPVSPSIEIRMELYVTKKKNACYHLCDRKIEINVLDFWDKKSDGACGHLSFVGEGGATDLYYILLKDAIDTGLEVKFETNTPGREVYGYVLAYYGDDFLYECQSEYTPKDYYSALLFLADRYVLKAGKIQLIKSRLPVPTKGSLIIKAYLEDARTGQVIMKNSSKFKPQFRDCSYDTISGWEDCSLHLKVDWQYRAQHL